MKKIMTAVLSFAMTMSAIGGVSAYAKNDIKVELDGAEISFDVAPQVINEKTMVPLRKIFEEIGALVKWDNDTKTVTARKSSKTITLTVGSNELKIDKGKTDEAGNPVIETVLLEVPAQTLSGRTLVPVRAISESFGMDVEWDQTNNKVIITSEDDEDDSWKDNTGEINLTDLTFSGNGIETEGNRIIISKGGDFIVKGKLADGNIKISTKEKVKLRLSGASITSVENPCIFVEDADKVYITLAKDTINTLVAENCNDGAIYSKENLEIKGDGSLNINSVAGHGIKASDNLSIENGNITINAESDGIHINDTFKMTGGNVSITATGDGIDSESIVIISDGKIDIKTNGVPISQPSDPNNGNGGNADNKMRFPMMEGNSNVEFEKSSKGINAAWMMCVHGGEININAASHAIHCDDEIVINGGTLELSSEYEKGISAHGNLTIGGSATKINITKSTEGIESKNVLTINDGIINVVATDDAINATGGKSGAMPGMGGNFGDRQNNPERAQAIEKWKGERIPPERYGKEGMNQNRTNPQVNMGENRGNGRFGNVPPNIEIPENGEFPPPNFGMPENGKFTSPSETTPQMNRNPGMQGGMFGMGRDMKDCLIINGGTIELYAEDDCVDSNGDLIINGGTIKATNPNGAFSGAFGIIDSDGQAMISEKVNFVFAATSGSDKSMKLSQNTIVVYCETLRKAGEKIIVSDESGAVIYEYNPQGIFSAVLISTEKLVTGKTYLIEIGEEKHEITISEQSTVVGTQMTANKGFGRGWNMQ